MTHKYLQVKIYPSGRISVVKCKKDYVDYTGGDLYSVYNGNRKKPISYDYFVTTETRYNKDCKKHFGKMLNELRKKYEQLDKKRDAIHKMIINTMI